MSTMATGVAPPSGDRRCSGELIAIGKVAEAIGVSERTLRYYEEVGLIVPGGHSPGGYRRYTAEDIARVVHIRELQAVMGYSLEEIQAILGARDRLAAIQAAWRSGQDRAEQERLLAEAIATQEAFRARVLAKLQRLQRILEELDATSARYARAAEELSRSPLVPGPPGAVPVEPGGPSS